MGYRKFPETVDEQIADIYEFLRRLRPHIFNTTIIQELGDGDGGDICPCPINIRICTPGAPEGCLYASSVLSDDPFIYYKVDETQGANDAVDYSGNGNDGTYIDFDDANHVTAQVPTLTCEGLAIESHDFPGIDFSLGADTPIDEYAMEAWVQPNVNDDGGILHLNVDNSNTVLVCAIYMADGVFKHFCRDSGGNKFVTGTTSVVVGETYHVVGVRGTDNFIRLYVNGEEEGTAVSTGTPTSAVGRDGNGWQFATDSTFAGHWNGVYDEPAVYYHELSAERVLAHYEAREVFGGEE